MNEKYYKAIDSLTPREESVEKTIEAVTRASQSGKVIEMKTRKFNKKFAAISAVAASLAIAITCGAFFLPGGVDTSQASSSSPTATQKQNGFFMTAYAAEATGDEAKATKITSDDFVKIGEIVPTVGLVTQSYSEIKQMSGLFNFDLKCEGENIDKVTYKIDNSTFCIKNDYKPVVSRDDKSTLDKDMGIIIGEEGEYSCYDSYTVDYDNQPNLSKYADDIKSPIQIFGSIKFDTEEDDKAIIVSNWKKYVIYNTVITVTATFKDGSTESQKLQLNSNRISDEEIVIEAKVIG